MNPKEAVRENTTIEERAQLAFYKPWNLLVPLLLPGQEGFQLSRDDLVKEACLRIARPVAGLDRHDRGDPMQLTAQLSVSRPQYFPGTAPPKVRRAHDNCAAFVSPLETFRFAPGLNANVLLNRTNCPRISPRLLLLDRLPQLPDFRMKAIPYTLKARVLSVGFFPICLRSWIPESRLHVAQLLFRRLDPHFQFRNLLQELIAAVLAETGNAFLRWRGAVCWPLSAGFVVVSSDHLRKWRNWQTRWT